jgi:hypothetical protein
VANVPLTPGVPPQVTEFISVRRNLSPAAWARRTAPLTVRAMPADARSLNTRGIVGKRGEIGEAHCESG